jgi:hypothetical protein
MVFSMSREPLQTVTIPVLIEAENADATDGWATLSPSEGRTKFAAVRRVGTDEVRARLPKIFPDKQFSLFRGLGRLQRAYEAKDEYALRAAIEEVRPWVPTIAGGSIKEDWTGEKIWDGARWEYSSLMSNAIQAARLVLWWPGGEDRLVSPALYCPDWKTAAFALSFMRSIRVCPKCGKPFVAIAENVDYCTPAHGVAYRTERSRWRAKRRLEGDR